MQLHTIAKETAFLVWVLDQDMPADMKEREVAETIEVLRPLLVKVGVMEEDGSLVEC